MAGIEPNMLDGYVSGRRSIITVRGKQYLVQYYQREHENEYTISEYANNAINGTCELYCNGMLVQSWKERNGQKEGSVFIYDHGVLKYEVRWVDLFREGDLRCFENTVSGMRLIVVDRRTGVVVYRGEYDNRISMQRNGKGYEFDAETGSVLSYGVYKDDSLFQLLQEFDGDGKMTVYATEEGVSNLAIQARCPLFYGGYIYDESSDSYILHGTVYGLDKKSGVAVTKGYWERGIKFSQVELYRRGDAEYSPKSTLREIIAMEMQKVVVVKSYKELLDISSGISSLVIASYSCNEEDIMVLSFEGYQRLTRLHIGSNNFKNTYKLTVANCPELLDIEIGTRCFCKQAKGQQFSSRDAAFSLSNCRSLLSMVVGCFSFVDYIHCDLASLGFPS